MYGLRALRRRLVAQDGFALPLALSVIAIAGLFAAAAVSFATHSKDRALRDRFTARAFAAADAGVEAASYRMNRALVASQVEGVFGLPAAAIAEAECIEVDLELDSLQVAGDMGNGWCQAVSGSEEVDGSVSGGDGPASFTYWVSTGINLGTDPDNPSQTLIERRIVSVGTAGGVQKRVLATAHGRLGDDGNLLQVFEQVGYRQCTAMQPDPADPGSGC